MFRPCLLLALIALVGLNSTALVGAKEEIPPLVPVPEKKNKPLNMSHTRTGLWGQATTVPIRGNWLDSRGWKKLLEAKEPDQILACFPPQTARVLAALALELGVETFFEAIKHPREGILNEEKEVELAFDVVQARVVNQRDVYQPVFILRKTKLKPPAPAAPPLAPLPAR